MESRDANTDAANRPSGCLPFPTGLKQDFHLRVAVPAEEGDGDGVLLAAEEEVEAAVADLQALDLEPVEEGGEARAAQEDLAVGGVDLKAEAGLQQRDRGAGGPGLRGAGDRVEGG
jgi:hypothetical protein